MRLVVSSLVFALIVAAAGCGRPPDRADLVFINGAEIESLDPAMSTAQATGRVLYTLYEGLTAFDSAARAVPGVAEKWELSPDGRTYTFHLRKNAAWSNGDRVTTGDFLYSWRRTLLPETGCEYAAQLYPIRNARLFNEGKLADFAEVGVRATDDLTLVVELENPTPFFLDLCAFVTLLPVHRATIERHEDWATNAEHFTGNGAFTLKEWRLFDRVRVTKNPHYWGAAQVALSSIDIMPSGKPMTAFNLYATGVADLMMDKGLAPTQLMNELRPRADFHSATILASYFVRYNVTRKPFDDVRVRLAFSLVFDKKLLTDKVTRAGEKPAYSFTPPGTGGNYQPPAGLTRDLERARRLLAEAGYPGGAGFPLISYLYRSDSDLDQDIAVELQAMLARDLGVKISLTRQEWTVYLNSQSKLDYDFCRSSWVADYNDPNTFLEMFTTDNGNNRTGWSDQRYDNAIASATREADPARRMQIFADAERILISEAAPIAPLYHYVGIQLYHPDQLGGVEPNLLDEHPLKTVFWKRRSR